MFTGDILMSGCSTQVLSVVKQEDVTICGKCLIYCFATRVLGAVMSSMQAVAFSGDFLTNGCCTQVLNVVASNKELIRADPLQQLHTMHNLAAQMSTGKLPAGVAQTLRDGSLMKEAAEIKDHYLAETVAKFAAAGLESKTSQTATVDARKQAVVAESGHKGACLACTYP